MGQPPAYAASDPSRAKCGAGDERRRVRQAIVQELSMQERLLLVLLYAERMNSAEIAATLNMTPTQVDVARERVVGRLESLLHAA